MYTYRETIDKKACAFYINECLGYDQSFLFERRLCLPCYLVITYSQKERNEIDTEIERDNC